MQKKILYTLKSLINSNYLVLTQSGDQAILLAMEAVKKIKPTINVQQPIANGQKPIFLIPDQSGWLSYQKYPKRVGFEIAEVKTDYGIIDLEDLKEKAKTASAFIYQNPAGYFAEQPSKQIYEICRGKCLVIKDIAGSIGDFDLCNSSDADFLVCSFGKWKPINLHYGGFISANNSEYFEKLDKEKAIFDESCFQRLEEELKHLKQKIENFYKLSRKIKNDLKEFEIIHKDKKGINVIVRYKDEEEKERITGYCKKNSLEFTFCPRYIRVLEKAVSIEVKR